MEKELEEAAKIANQVEDAKPDYQDKIVQELASHGTHKNMSFFCLHCHSKGQNFANVWH
ncbi:type III restriction protein res subunit [Coraliomargarita sp. CAG:312]|nr:type III restriction protein res subunit [Coraliomargarita sp. CAG:312]